MATKRQRSSAAIRTGHLCLLSLLFSVVRCPVLSHSLPCCLGSCSCPTAAGSWMLCTEPCVFFLLSLLSLSSLSSLAWAFTRSRVPCTFSCTFVLVFVSCPCLSSLCTVNRQLTYCPCPRKIKKTLSSARCVLDTLPRASENKMDTWQDVSLGTKRSLESCCFHFDSCATYVSVHGVNSNRRPQSYRDEGVGRVASRLCDVLSVQQKKNVVSKGCSLS